MNRLSLLVVVLSLAVGSAWAQAPDVIFHTSAGLYIGEKTNEAKEMLDDGLRKYPNDAKLTALRNMIKEEEKKKQDQNNEQKDKDQQQKDQEKKEQEQKDKEKKEKDKQEQDQKDKEKKEQEKKDQQQKPEDEKKDQKEPQPSSEKMKQMKISQEKAKMVLEAMKNQEIQYLQQNKRKAKKPKDSGKPDW